MSFSTNCTNLFTLAHTKLRSSFRGENWRRVVLHKTILLSPSQPTGTVEPGRTSSDAFHDDDHFDDNSDDVPDVAHDYLFPDAGNFVEYSATGTHSSEAQWLDSLLESLGDDDDEYFGPPSSPPSATATTALTSGALAIQKSEHEEEEEDEHLFSPSTSPMSSSDDLTALSHQHSYYPSTSPSSSLSSSSSSSSSSYVQYPYISPYPPFHPPLSLKGNNGPYAFVSVSPFNLPAPYEDPLPFSDDVDDMPVPDAIEDTSDDESDAPPTPSLGGSRSSLYSDVDVEVLDAASIPLPRDRSGLRHALSTLRGYDPLDAVCHYSYHPFSDDALSSYNIYSEF